jgi:ER membrane protein complex subunit 2
MPVPQVGMFRQAAFCFEELLLHAPHHFHYHLRFADTLYTIGAPQSIKAARAHYSEAVVLSGGKSLRALFGLVACASHANDKVRGGAVACALVAVS